MPTPPTGCLCRQCPPSEQNVKATSAGVSRVAGQGPVRACCPRLIGGGNRHGVRSRNPRVRRRAGEPVLRAGRACPDQHGGRICEQFAAGGAGTPAGAGYPRGRLLAGSAGAYGGSHQRIPRWCDRRSATDEEGSPGRGVQESPDRRFCACEGVRKTFS